MEYLIQGGGASLRRLALHKTHSDRIYWNSRTEKGGGAAMWGGNRCWLGFCALALGSAILIVAIFPVGFLMFLVAFLLIACGWGCMRRR